MDRHELLRRVGDITGMSAEEDRLRVARAVVCALRERLEPEEASHLERVLVPDFPELLACSLPEHRHRAGAPDEQLTEPELAERVRLEGRLEGLAQSRRAIREVLAVISARLGGAEAEEEPAPAPTNEVRKTGSLGRPPRGRGGGEDDES